MLLSLSALFEQRLALPEGTKPDLMAQGLERWAEVLDAVALEPRAGELLVAAAARFQEAAAAALYNGGNVATLRAKKRAEAAQHAAAQAALDKALAGGDSSPDAATRAARDAGARALADTLPAFDAALAAASAKWAHALEIKGDHGDARLALGQQLFERAKLLALRGAETPPRATAGEVDAAFAAAAAKFDDALALLPPADAAGVANLHILAGNVLFEHSQVAAARPDAPDVWQALLDAAVARFKTAGCAETDITRALENHAGARAAAKAIAA